MAQFNIQEFNASQPELRGQVRVVEAADEEKAAEERAFGIVDGTGAYDHVRVWRVGADESTMVVFKTKDTFSLTTFA